MKIEELIFILDSVINLLKKINEGRKKVPENSLIITKLVEATK